MIRDELKFLGKNKLLVFVMAVILLIPAIYAGMFLSSMWDPYGDISKLPVAVVNNDVAVDYNGKTLSVGDNLSDSLESNDSMDFHITDQVTAENGLKDGRYYMVITIPEDFSQNASSVMDNNPKKMQLQYTTNPGYNYISSKLSESAIKEIKANIMAEVTTTYTNAVFDSIAELGDGFSQAADGTAELLNGMDSLNDGANKLADGASQLVAGSNALLTGATDMKNQIDNSLTSDKVDQINLASSSLLTMNENIQKLNGAVSAIDVSGIGAAGQSAGASLQNAGTDLNNAAANLVGGYAATANPTDLGGGALKVIETYKTLAYLYQDPTLTDVQRTLIGQAMTKLYDANDQLAENTAYDDIVGAAGNIKDAGGNIQAAGGTLSALAASDMSGQVEALQSSVEQLAAASDKLLPASSQALGSLLTGMQTIQAGVNKSLLPGIVQLNAGVQSLNTGITGTDGLQSGVQALKAGSRQLIEKGNDLQAGANQLSDGTARLSDGARALADGSVALQDGVTTLIDGTDTLNTALSDGADKVADSAVNDSNIDMFVTPLETEETQITIVANNGHAMAAYMMSVGLWVGCLAFCLMYPLVECRGKLKNGFSWFMSKAIVVYPTAIIMALVLYLTLHFVNGFNPIQVTNTILVSVVTGICFMTIMYFFNALLGKVGSFFMLVFMVLQLAGSAGTYPIEISGSFAAAIHKYVPFTYTVNAFRSAISGGADIGNELMVLTALTVIFMAMTVVLFWYRAERINAGKAVAYTWIEEHGLA